jgi:AcrR family transcriptional regulator
MEDDCKNIVNYNETQLRFFDAGWQLFNEHGIRKTTIEQICATAEISKVTFYKYFKNKEDFLYQLMDKEYTEAITEVDQIFKQDETYQKRMNRLMQWKLSQLDIWKKPFLDDLLTFGAPMIAFLTKWSAVSTQSFVQFVRKGQADGEIRQSVNPEFIMDLLGTLIQNVYSENGSLHQKYDWDEMTRQLMDFFIYGILGKECDE